MLRRFAYTISVVAVLALTALTFSCRDAGGPSTGKPTTEDERHEGFDLPADQPVPRNPLFAMKAKDLFPDSAVWLGQMSPVLSPSGRRLLLALSFEKPTGRMGTHDGEPSPETVSVTRLVTVDIATRHKTVVWESSGPPGTPPAGGGSVDVAWIDDDSVLVLEASGDGESDGTRTLFRLDTRKKGKPGIVRSFKARSEMDPQLRFFPPYMMRQDHVGNVDEGGGGWRKTTVQAFDAVSGAPRPRLSIAINKALVALTHKIAPFLVGVRPTGDGFLLDVRDDANVADLWWCDVRGERKRLVHGEAWGNFTVVAWRGERVLVELGFEDRPAKLWVIDLGTLTAARTSMEPPGYGSQAGGRFAFGTEDAVYVIPLKF